MINEKPSRIEWLNLQDVNRSGLSDHRPDPDVEAPVDEGNDRTGSCNKWYEWAVPLADDVYVEYFRELGEKGSL